MTDRTKYPVRVFWSDDDHGFIAVADDLPGCSAFGESKAEALAELDDAMESWVAAATAEGRAIPAPSDPAKSSQYSGKLLVRMPRDLHRRLAERAAREMTSLNQFCNYLLSSGVSASRPWDEGAPLRMLGGPHSYAHALANFAVRNYPTGLLWAFPSRDLPGRVGRKPVEVISGSTGQSPWAQALLPAPVVAQEEVPHG